MNKITYMNLKDHIIFLNYSLNPHDGCPFSFIDIFYNIFK